MAATALAFAFVREAPRPYAITCVTTARPARPRAEVLVVSGSFALVTRLQRALGAAFDVLPRATVVEAARELATRPIAAMLLEPEDAHGAPTAALAWRARESAGGRSPVSVVAIVRRSDGWTAPTLALIEAQPGALVVAEDLDIGCVVRALSTRLGRAVLLDDVWPAVERVLPVVLRPLARLALEREGAPLKVSEAARALGLHRKTLWTLCRRHGVASVQLLLMWCRVIAAAHALRTRVSSVDAIAHDLEFASPTALRNVIRRYLGMTATELRLQGGEELACRGFATWLSRGACVMDDARVAGEPRVTAGDVA